MPHHWRPLAHKRNFIFKGKQHTVNHPRGPEKWTTQWWCTSDTLQSPHTHKTPAVVRHLSSTNIGHRCFSLTIQLTTRWYPIKYLNKIWEKKNNLDISSLFTTLFLWTSLKCILSWYNKDASAATIASLVLTYQRPAQNGVLTDLVVGICCCILHTIQSMQISTSIRMEQCVFLTIIRLKACDT